jgi:hypothetical protein
MPSATTVTVAYAVLTILVVGAWIAGYLDRYQKMAQNVLLGAMGDNRMSYGLKSKLQTITLDFSTETTAGTIKQQEISNDEDFKDLQNTVADTAGGIVGTGGIGESIGNTVSKGL